MLTSCQRLMYRRLVFYISLGSVYMTVVISQDLNEDCCEKGGPCLRPCRNEGICHQSVCLCQANYYGRVCQFVREKPVSCKRPCQNGGTCIDRRCVCADKYYGTACQFTEDKTPRGCINLCQNGGICNTLTGFCICSDDYEGNSCENSKMSTLNLIPNSMCRFSTDCNGNGICLDDGHCGCNVGYHGDRCQFGNGLEEDNDNKSTAMSHHPSEYVVYFVGCIIVVVILAVVLVVRASIRRQRMRCQNQTVATLDNTIRSFITASIHGSPPDEIRSVSTDPPPAYHTVQESLLQELPPSYEEALKLRQQPLIPSDDMQTEFNSEPV
uniref:Multiple epidermal growth factor-like domains protein 6-like isoform X2 n=1 Tax=Saccoglossus kowalevskii TaxID=10224 RepID=A0ABM0M759_SACKO|nr:PREDICTED: multiple epidermal growth factor-like domains protein 6-like isoform X2 [Saccoglossus kowalevskii]